MIASAEEYCPFFRSLKTIDTPVDQQLCVITGDDSHTVQLDRVKVCICIASNKTLK